MDMGDELKLLMNVDTISLLEWLTAENMMFGTINQKDSSVGSLMYAALSPGFRGKPLKTIVSALFRFTKEDSPTGAQTLSHISD